MIKKSIVVVAMILLSGSGFAQQTDGKGKPKAPADAAWVKAGCGPDTVRFDVRMDKNQHTLAEPEHGKALIYVFEDDLTRSSFPTTRVGLDGKWIGANLPGSYLFFSIEPGAHRICSNWQGEHVGAALDFTADAGKVYFLRAGITSFGSEAFTLDLVPEAQGYVLIATHGVSTSAEKPADGN